MITIKRLGIYLATFLIVVIVAITAVNWKWLDKYLVSIANKNNNDNSLNKKIVLVDLEKPVTASEAESFKLFRLHLIQFLNNITQQTKENNAPEGIVLDIWFSNDTTELASLKSVLQQLKDLHVPVYAVYNINEEHEYTDIEKINFEEIEIKHATDLYNNYFAGSDGKLPGTGRYHTFFYPENDVANYENDIYLSSSLFDSVLIESLTRKVYTDLTDSKPTPKRVGSVVPLRSTDVITKKTYTFIADSIQSPGIFKSSTANAAPIDVDKNIIIVGDTRNDLIDFNDKKIPGPYILAWALSDLLGNNSTVSLPLENLYVILGQILFFSFFVVLVFALLFKYAKKLQTKPAFIAVLSFAIAMILFFIYGKLTLSFNTVIPAGHTIVAMFVAAILSWRFAHKFLVTGVAEGGEKYDVFISYSRSKSDWVYKNIYEPLAEFKKPNGDKLKIFFDKKSIGIGEAFTAKYMWAIVDSKCFIPILSEDYYGKNHCRNELDCAIKRWVEKLLIIQAVAFSFKAVPEAYNSINCVDISANPAFIEDIKAKLSQL